MTKKFRVVPCAVMGSFRCLCAAACLSWCSSQTAAAAPFSVADEAAFFQMLDLSRPELSGVASAVRAGDWPRAREAWATHLERRASPSWIWSRHDRRKILAAHEKNSGGLSRHVKAADSVLARDFELLGVRKQLGRKVEWLQGPVEWTHVLSRFDYWNDLGKAYWATGNRAYAADFVELLTDWVASNPVPETVSNERGKRGTVWRTLEAGMRAQGWFGAMQFFMDAPEFDAGAKYVMTRSLVEHANYLAAWTTGYRNGNWQVCEASGLACIGIMLPEFKAAAGWRRVGLDMLAQHMKRDVENDGSHWELTPSYHTWVMKEFLHVARLCEINGIPMPGFREKHGKMFEVLQKLSRPDGTWPPVGDAGTGASSVAPAMGMGALLYQRPDFRFLSSSACEEEWIWLLGADACERLAAVKRAPPAFTSVLLPDARYAVMRTGWGRRDRYLLFDCAPWRGGHSHQDRLQVTVFAGRDLIVDSGMISYDNPASPPLRKSSAHNVLVIDGGEQPQADPVLSCWHTGPQADFASGSVTAGGFTHQRGVLHVKPHYWVVFDHVSGEGEHELTRFFQFAPGAVEVQGKAVQTCFPDGTNIRVEVVDDAVIDMRKGKVAAGAVQVAETSVAALVSKGALPRTLCTVLLPFVNPENLPVVTGARENPPGQSRLLVRFPNGQRDEIIIATAPREMGVGNHRSVARALCLRRGPLGNALIRIPGGMDGP